MTEASVLIVEDDRAARRAIGAILRKRGFAVCECGSVADALRGLSNPNSAPPQWVLLDLMLPDGSGIDVIRAVRGKGMPTQVCVVTGCCAEQVNEARRAGATFAFTKPLNLNRLMAALTTQPVGEA